jgi:hypothetical protein
MTLSLSDLSGINSNVRCDPSGSIASTNTKKIVDALKKLADEFGGESLEDIVNNLISLGGGGSRKCFTCFGVGGVMLAGSFPEMDRPFNFSVSTNTSRWQIEPDNITITDITGGGPFLVIISAIVEPQYVRNSSGNAYLRLERRLTPLSPYGPQGKTEIRNGWTFPDIALPAGNSAGINSQTGSRTVLYQSGTAGNQYKAVLGVRYIGSANPPSSVDLEDWELHFIEL